MSDLPEIPVEAVCAVLVSAGMDPDSAYGPGEIEWASSDLAAALPYIYAASLRHAAEALSDVPEMCWPGDALREMADRVTP